MSEIFISYSSTDEKQASIICEKLDYYNITYFLASKSIKTGFDFGKEIKKALQSCFEFFILISKASIKSEWVKQEYWSAWILDKHIVPILYECTTNDLPSKLKDLHARDFFEFDKVIAEYKERRKHVNDELKKMKKSVNFDSIKQNEITKTTPVQSNYSGPNFKINLEKVISKLPEKIAFVSDADAIMPFEFVENEEYNPEINLFPDFYKDRILIDTIHAGDIIPDEFYKPIIGAPSQKNIPRQVRLSFDREKDWGANYVAYALTKALNLKGFYKVNISRVLLDFGRFPGITQRGDDYLRRFAINYPFSYFLSYADKKKLLEKYYDVISNEMEKAVENVVLKIAIHTYDKFNVSSDQQTEGTIRPTVSLLYSPLGYHEEQRMPFGVFDKLYPDQLAEFTADRILTSRIALDLESNRIPVAHNHPYHLPEGSMEVRSQVWFFFSYLKKEFESEYPETSNATEYKMVWQMLKDTNLRSTDSEILRSHLHMFRQAHPKRTPSLEKARKAYEKIENFLKRKDSKILDEYRHSPVRPSSLAIEIRKDYVWNFQDKECTQPIDLPDGLNLENLEKITKLLANAILTYLKNDSLIHRSKQMKND